MNTFSEWINRELKLKEKEDGNKLGFTEWVNKELKLKEKEDMAELKPEEKKEKEDDNDWRKKELP